MGTINGTNNYMEELKNLVLSAMKDCDASILLFGSRARGDNAPGADVDIAVSPRTCSVSRAITLLKEAIEESRIPYKVDIVNLEETSPSFREEILESAVVWRD